MSNKINIPALPRPTLKELQQQWSWIKSIEKDISPIKKTALELITVLEEGEKTIGGDEYEKRLPNDILGFQQAQWLVEHQNKFQKFMKSRSEMYIDFPAIIVVGADGVRRIPCLGRRWKLSWDWLGGGFHGYGRVASSCKSTHLPQILTINGKTYKLAG